MVREPFIYLPDHEFPVTLLASNLGAFGSVGALTERKDVSAVRPGENGCKPVDHAVCEPWDSFRAEARDAVLDDHRGRLRSRRRGGRPALFQIGMQALAQGCGGCRHGADVGTEHIEPCVEVVVGAPPANAGSNP